MKQVKAKCTRTIENAWNDTIKRNDQLPFETELIMKFSFFSFREIWAGDGDEL